MQGAPVLSVSLLCRLRFLCLLRKYVCYSGHLLLGPFFCAALFLVSLTPLGASLPVSFLRCYVRCAFAVGKSECRLRLVCLLRKFVCYSGNVSFVLFLRFCFWSLLLHSPPCLLLFCAAMSGVPVLSVSLLCRLRFLCLRRKYVCYSGHSTLVPSSLWFCFWSLWLPSPPCWFRFCAAMSGAPLLSVMECHLRLLCLLRKYVCHLGYVCFVFSSLRFCFWSLLLPSSPCMLLCCAAMSGNPFLSVSRSCRLRLLCLLRKYVCYSGYVSFVPSSVRFFFRAFVVGRSVMSVTFVVLLRKYVWYSGYVSCVSSLWLCFWSFLLTFLLACLFSVYVRCAFAVAKSVMLAYLLCLLASTSVTPASSLWSLCLCCFASVSLTPLASLSAPFLRCYVSCAFVVSRSVVSVTFVIHTTQVLLVLRRRLLCPFSAVLLLVSLTLLALLPASFLHCYVRCSFSVSVCL